MPWAFVNYIHTSMLSYQAVKNRENLVVTTGTASGKTYCYNLPILDQLIKVPIRRALFIFPTKALTHDQQEKLIELTNFMDGLEPQSHVPVCVYDGDTPSQKRQIIRQTARCLVDQSGYAAYRHTSPSYPVGRTSFAGLEFVVIDEIHAYRGVFGSHVANVIRRLKRIAAFYGSKPQFILTSATIANPEEHGKALVGEDLVLMDSGWSTTWDLGLTLFYNPPVFTRRREFGKVLHPKSFAWPESCWIKISRY